MLDFYNVSFPFLFCFRFQNPLVLLSCMSIYKVSFTTVSVFFQEHPLLTSLGNVSLLMQGTVSFSFNFDLFNKKSESICFSIRSDLFVSVVSFTMSVTNVFSIIGDSNVRRNMTAMNIASRQSLATCQMIDCPDLNNLEGAFASIRDTSTVCVFSAISELLVHCEDRGTVQSSVEHVMTSLAGKLGILCRARSGLTVMLAPPMYRTTPLWYRQHLPELAHVFSEVFSKDKPPNLVKLPSFINQDILEDGYSLNPVTGLYYLLHLIDESEKLLLLCKSGIDENVKSNSETSRSNRDRIVMLEHDHFRLALQVNRKVAADAEFSEWVLNRSEENWLTISNLPRLSGSLSKSDWQKAAKSQVRACLLEVVRFFKVNIRFDVIVVTNPIKNAGAKLRLLNVRLSSVEASKAIRDAFSGFFRGGANSPTRPPALKGIDIRNKVTFETRVRVAILKQLGQNYHASNPGSSWTVRGFVSRPQIVIVPASNSADTRVRTWHYMDAINMLPVTLSDDNLVQIHRVIGGGFQGRLASLFVILSDEDRDRISELIKTQPRFESLHYSLFSFK